VQKIEAEMNEFAMKNIRRSTTHYVAKERGCVRKKMIAAFPPAARTREHYKLPSAAAGERERVWCGMAKGNSRYLRYMAPYTQHKIERRGE
jgi:hypothetical protein